MNENQNKAYNIGYKTASVGVTPGGKARLDKTAFTVNNASSSFGGDYALAGNLYDYYVMGFNQAQADMANKNVTPEFPNEQAVHIIEMNFKRLKRSYTAQDMGNWISIAKSNWISLGASANVDALASKLVSMFNSLPPSQEATGQGATSQEVEIAINQPGGLDNLQTVIGMNLPVESPSITKSSLLAGSLQSLGVGTYVLEGQLDLQSSILQYAQKELLGNSTVTLLNTLAAEQKETLLPVANKRIRVLEFSTSDAVPVLIKTWKITFEVLEEKVLAQDCVNGFATLAGLSPQYLSNCVISKKTETVSGNVGTSSSNFLVLGLVVLGVWALAKFIK